MEEIKQWILVKLGISELEWMGGVLVLVSCFLIYGMYLLKNKAPFLIACMQRLLLGVVLIFSMNQILSMLHLPLEVGIGLISLLTCTILGIPGVCLLYAILLL